MRLICPECGAQYEVVPTAIPPEGRDVQCSNCGHVWFEVPGEAGEAGRLGPAPAPPAAPPPAPDVDADPGPDPWAEVPRAEFDDEEADDLADASAAEAEPPAPPRPSVTPAAAEILRAEAAREAAARVREEAARAEAPAPTPFRRLGPDRAGPSEPAAPPGPTPPQGRELERAQEARRRVASLARAPVPEPAPSVAPSMARSVAPASPRRDRPDVATIDPTPDRSGWPLVVEPEAVAPAAPRRRGLGTGFWSVVVLGVLLGLAYGFADPVARAVPATAAVLGPYRDALDESRSWLDGRLGGFMEASGETDAAPATAVESPAAPATGE